MSTSSSSRLARQELSRLLEQDARAPGLTRSDLEQYCRQAMEFGFFGVCVSSSRVVQAAHWLEGSEVKVICSISHPGGGADSDVKRFETEVAIDGGAHVIELMLDSGRLNDGDEDYLLRELRDVVEAADERPVGVGLDLVALGDGAAERGMRLALEAGADGVTLRGAPALLAARCASPWREKLGVKVDLEEFDLGTIAELITAGVVRFGVRDGAGLLRGLP